MSFTFQRVFVAALWCFKFFRLTKPHSLRLFLTEWSVNYKPCFYSFCNKFARRCSSSRSTRCCSRSNSRAQRSRRYSSSRRSSTRLYSVYNPIFIDNYEKNFSFFRGKFPPLAPSKRFITKTPADARVRVRRGAAPEPKPEPSARAVIPVPAAGQHGARVVDVIRVAIMRRTARAYRGCVT